MRIPSSSMYSLGLLLLAAACGSSGEDHAFDASQKGTAGAGAEAGGPSTGGTGGDPYGSTGGTGGDPYNGSGGIGGDYWNDDPGAADEAGYLAVQNCPLSPTYGFYFQDIDGETTWDPTKLSETLTAIAERRHGKYVLTTYSVDSAVGTSLTNTHVLLLDDDSGTVLHAARSASTGDNVFGYAHQPPQRCTLVPASYLEACSANVEVDNECVHPEYPNDLRSLRWFTNCVPAEPTCSATAAP